MNFRDLEYIVEAAKRLSFSRAAESCNVSQPSLSAQIKKTEQELGAEIFIRANRKIFLTSYGEEFVTRAQDILSKRNELRRSAAKHKDPLSGKISLGGILTVAPYLFPDIVKQVSRKAPKLRLSLKEAKTEDLLKDLLTGRIDAALLSLPIDEHVFESHLLVDEAFYVGVSENHPLAKSDVIFPEELAGCELTLLEEGHCFRAQALEICRTAAVQENALFTATSLETIRQFIAIGEGVTLMPAMAMRKNDGIRYIPLQGDQYHRQIGFVWRKNAVKKPQIEKLMSLIEG